jgi:hypothetical protein
MRISNKSIKSNGGTIVRVGTAPTGEQVVQVHEPIYPGKLQCEEVK